MKLSQDLPQFEDKPTLIITVGWQSGKVFYAYKKEVVLNKEIKIEDKKYTDHEGHFEMRTRSGDVQVKSSTPIEDNKERVRKEFLDELVDHLESLVNKYKIKEIFIFSSKEGTGSLKKYLPKEISKITKKIYKGNYAHKKPDELVELLKKKRPQPIKVMKEEAKKILDKTKRFFKK